MMKSQSTFLIFVSLSMLFSGCNTGTENDDVKIDANLQEVLTISEETTDSPLFAFVYDAVSDNQGNIYFVDPSTQNIHSFDAIGSYRWTIGGRGQGPGEFQFVSSIHTDDENRLYVYDSERVILTIFNKDGDILDNRSFDFGRKTIEHIRKSPNNRLILPYWDEGKLIHIYSLDSGEIEGSLVDFREQLQTDDEIENELFQTNPGSAIALNESLIAYTPEHYAGKLYLFEKIEDSFWQLKESIRGYKQFDPSITFHVSQDGSHERSHFSGYNPRGGGTYVHYEFHSMSQGLYNLDRGSIVHLSYQSVEDEMHLVIEHFDLERNQFQSYSIIDNFGIDFRPQKRPVWVDSKSQIYLADNSDMPKLRVLRLEYE